MNELKRIGTRVRMTDGEFEAMVAKVKDEVQREKRQLLRRSTNQAGALTAARLQNKHTQPTCSARG